MFCYDGGFFSGIRTGAEVYKVNNRLRKIREEDFLLAYLDVGVWKRLFADVNIIKKYIS